MKRTRTARSGEAALRIAIVCHPTFGGSGAVAAELAVALGARGHRVHVFSYARPFRLPDHAPGVRFHEVQVTSYPLFKYPPYSMSLAAQLVDAYRREPFDLIHAHYAVPHAACAYLARSILHREASLRIVTTLHGTDTVLLGLDRSFFEVTRFSLQESDGVTAVSRELALRSRRVFHLPRAVRVIPNFVDTDFYTPARRDPQARVRLGEPGEALIGHVSNFRDIKRIPDVVRVFHAVQREVPARLILMGEGPELEPARVLASALGIEERVSFLGATRDVASVLPQLDVFLLPSEYESFGLSALEALSSGVPVVASRVGGLPEVVEQGKSGFLEPVGAVRAMARRVVQLLRHPARLAAMREAARASAVDRFPVARVVARYEALYRRTLRQPRRLECGASAPRGFA